MRSGRHRVSWSRMPTFEHYIAYGISKASQRVRSLPRSISRAWRRRRHGIADLADLWQEVPETNAFGAVLDILGFSELMRRDPAGAHVQMNSFQGAVQNAVARVGNGNVTAALVSDSAFLVGQNVQDLAAVAMTAIHRCFLSNPIMLVHGYLDRGDYRLSLPLPGAPQSPHFLRIHWAGQGVLGIGLEEMFLPKGAALFLSPRIDDPVLPVVSHRFLWSNVRTLDWAEDTARRAQLAIVWNNVNARCPPELAHVIATKSWLSRAGARHNIQLASGPWPERR